MKNTDYLQQTSVENNEQTERLAATTVMFTKLDLIKH